MALGTEQMRLKYQLGATLDDDVDMVCRFDAYHQGVAGKLSVSRTALKWTSVGANKTQSVSVPMNAIVASNLSRSNEATIDVDVDDGRVFSFEMIERDDARMTQRALASPTLPARALRHRRRVSFRRRARAHAAVDPAEEAAARRASSPVPMATEECGGDKVMAFSEDDDNSGGYDEKSDSGAEVAYGGMASAREVSRMTREVVVAASGRARALMTGQGARWWKRHALDVVVCAFALLTLVFAMITIVLADVFVFQVRHLGVSVSSLRRY